MIAIVTGASAGLGAQFARQIAEQFPEIDTLWLIARRVGKLEDLAQTIEGKQVICLGLDLCDAKSFKYFADHLAEKRPKVGLLVNNAGCGTLGNLGEVPNETQARMCDLNVRALTLMTNTVLPYMVSGGHIINVSSIASFCPNPRMTVYSAGKAYVSAFTYGIGYELQSRGITATAVCPGPMDTDFIYLGEIKGNSKTFDTLPYCDPAEVVRGAYKAAKAGKANYTPKAFYRFYRILAKLLPVRLVMKMAKT